MLRKSFVFCISYTLFVLLSFPVNGKTEELLSTNDHIDLANKYKEEQKWELARNEYNEIIKADPKAFRHYISRGFIEIQLKNYKAALANAEQASALTTFNGNVGLISLLRARAYAALKNNNDSIKQYLDATARLPNNYEAQFELGKLFYQMKRFDEAYVCLSKAYEKFSSVKKNQRLIEYGVEAQKMLDDIKKRQANLKTNSAKKKNQNKSPD